MTDFAVLRLLIEFTGALFIAGYAFAAMLVLATTRDVTRARLMVIEGVLLGLSIKLAATLLRTIELHTWDQILAFASILAMRTLLKRMFVWEQSRLLRSRLSRERRTSSPC